jgi:hypothetical protein
LLPGYTLSEWYINRLTRTWVERGNIISAHHMINQGLIYFYDMLFGLNNELVPDMKWRQYCVEQLERLPGYFKKRLRETMTLRSFSTRDLEKRISPFMDMWNEMKPIIEAETKMTLEEMEQVV